MKLPIIGQKPSKAFQIHPESISSCKEVWLAHPSATNTDMSNRTLIITSAFMVTEILAGVIPTQLLLGQYNMWTSSMSPVMMAGAVLLIYAGSTFILGTLNLMAISRLEKALVIRCSLTAALAGTLTTVLILMLPDKVLLNWSDTTGIRGVVFVFLGVLTGFNFPILKGWRRT